MNETLKLYHKFKQCTMKEKLYFLPDPVETKTAVIGRIRFRKRSRKKNIFLVAQPLRGGVGRVRDWPQRKT